MCLCERSQVGVGGFFHMEGKLPVVVAPPSAYLPQYSLEGTQEDVVDNYHRGAWLTPGHYTKHKLQGCVVEITNPVSGSTVDGFPTSGRGTYVERYDLLQDAGGRRKQSCYTAHH